MPSISKYAALGIPVINDSVILPDTEDFRKYAGDGLLLGRNPYSAKRIQKILPENIKYLNELDTIQVFQYTLSGLYYDEILSDYAISFFKGLLISIEDENWPENLSKFDFIVSSEDQKINSLWHSKNKKQTDKISSQEFQLAGILKATKEYANQVLIGLPVNVAKNLAGDFDGDLFDVFSVEKYPKFSNLIENQSINIIPCPKIKKTFTKRKNIGNWQKIISLKYKLLET